AEERALIVVARTSENRLAKRFETLNSLGEDFQRGCNGLCY
ncbi:MAG: hypothetical protein ACI8UZ_000839, partial [Akkermansiaceae bacterium]